ncbi:toxin-antitoxin system, antitoxin component [Leptospira sp. 201903070]|uniref:Toxin-antitoxin system, antitoxin component n=2 Tax=Leptospira TaxID=171 RepID=A0A396Z5S5_9LEPT|nr:MULTISPECIES: CopG family transcriptional regulator [Leptospira]MBM9578655.1 toxin-antitoxin system, antitoxin component [Leptospira ainlahdjerensis]RHX89048.1 toxin-antitoxin system, antitoxin component [Leptospira stimsonii]
MPQVSLYLDQDTLKKIETAAKKEKISISQWVRVKIQSSFDKSWPEEYFNLFGSIQDESFSEPKRLKFASDTKREEL